MALIDTVATTRVTVPSFLVGKQNGQLSSTWLRAPDGSTRTDFKMFVPVSYAMQALHLDSKGIIDRTTGRYRSYTQQVNLFLSRYVKYDTGSSSKVWNGVRYWKRPGVAMAATPGTSNHGLGLADDLAEERDSDTAPESMGDAQLTWMRDNAPSFGFGLETRSERWHWHWIGGNKLSQRAVDVLHRNGIKIPSLTAYGFYVPAPTVSPAPAPQPDKPLPTPPGTPAMRIGSTDANTVVTGWPGGRVTVLQQIIGDVEVDGYYGPQTAAKIAELQRSGNIEDDGVYGQQTANLFWSWREAQWA